jgi:CspA family cold shock protein
VKWFDAQKGFGFIDPKDRDEDAFVHYSDIQSEGLATLNEGQEVDFRLTQTEKGLRAVHVVPLDAEEMEKEVSPQPERPEVLICISTRQQMANLLPIEEFNPKRVVALTTEYARRAGWNEWLDHACEPKVETLMLEADGDLEPAEICACAVERLGRIEGPVVLAWAGGQKPMSTGLWLAFEDMYESGRAATAAYVDQNRGELLVWTSPRDMKRSDLTTRVSIPQAFTAAGVKISEKQEYFQIWPPEENLPEGIIRATKLFQAEQDYRRLCFELAQAIGEDENEFGLSTAEETKVLKRAYGANVNYEDITEKLVELLFRGEDNLQNQWLKELSNVRSGSDACARQGEEALRRVGENRRNWLAGKVAALRTYIGYEFWKTSPPQVELPDNRTVMDLLEDSKDGELALDPVHGRMRLAPPKGYFSATDHFPTLFEYFVIQRVRMWAHNHADDLTHVLANAECEQSGRGQVMAEFDVVVLNRSGRMTVLDAKTYTQGNQRRRAQRMSAQQVGGAFTRRYEVYPMFDEDIGSPDRRQPKHKWGTKSWYPRELANQIAHWVADQEEYPSAAMNLIPFDGQGKFEDALSRLCIPK